MTDTMTGSEVMSPLPTENASTEQQTSSNDAATSQKASKKQTPADKFKQVNDLITGALTPDDVTRVSDDDDDNGGQHEPADGVRSASGGEGGDADAAYEPSVSSPPKTLTDIADKLGVKVKDLYDIEVPLKAGEGTMTLGAIKDAYQDNQTVRQEVVQRAVELDERETRITNEQRLWTQIGNDLVDKLPDGTREQLINELQQTEQRERQMLLQAMPELRDQTKFDAFRDEVVQTLSKYGFQPQEIVVSDHRQLMVVRDLARAQKRLKELREFKPTLKTPNSVASRGRSSPASNKQRIINNARNSNNPSDKTRAAAALINGG